MSFRGAFYEALTWCALEQAKKTSVTYEPPREQHTCERLCPYQNACTKPQVHSRLIHTTPDFLISATPPTYVHVCYWDSKETSHAKYWRTVSEIGELKCFRPDSRSMSIVFETEHSRGAYSGIGWYPEFLRALHLVFDHCVFFSSSSLSSDVESARAVLKDKASAADIYQHINSNPKLYASLPDLVAAINGVRHPDVALHRSLDKVWQWEQEFCSSITPFVNTPHLGERLRNAILQVVLLKLLTNTAASDLLVKLHKVAKDLRGAFQGRNDLVQLMTALPISNREKKYQHLASNIKKGVGRPWSCDLSEDLEWIVTAVAAGTLPISREAIVEGIELTAARFAASDQVVESIESIQESLAGNALANIGSWNADDWISAYKTVPKEREYNLYGELIIECVGLGTYPLVQVLSTRWPDEYWSRNHLRSLYSNRRSPKADPVSELLIRRLASLVPKGKKASQDRVAAAYLYRKVARIVGPQSAINPLEELAVAVIAKCRLAKGVALKRGVEVETLTSTITNGAQLGLWRVGFAFSTPKGLIPVFLSAMKSPGDCAHKAREFAGHLRHARYLWNGVRFIKSEISSGVAILEGGYSEDDKRAFHLAGYKVCSLDNLDSILKSLGVVQ
jgi:hypothetical protein